MNNKNRESRWDPLHETEPPGTVLTAGCGEIAAGTLPLPEGQFEPFGETRFVELAEWYGQCARRLADEGARALFCGPLPSLGACRAVLLGARYARLPIYVALLLLEDGRAAFGSDPMAALLTAQALGAAAFGFGAGSDARSVREALARLLPVADVPLLAFPENADEADSFARAGASILSGAPQFRDIPRASPPRAARDRRGIIAVCDSGCFVLGEGFEFSEPAECGLDMSDTILQAEDDGQDALLVHVGTFDDAYAFSYNAHMARLPVAFVAEREEVLEMALALFHGLAIIDARCDLPRQTLERLARDYGATVI